MELKTHGLCFCIHDYHGIEVPEWITGRVAYGVGRSPEKRYSQTALRRAAAKIRKALAECYDAHVYFNNDAYGHAVDDAARLKVLLDDERDQHGR